MSEQQNSAGSSQSSQQLDSQAVSPAEQTAEQGNSTGAAHADGLTGVTAKERTRDAVRPTGELRSIEPSFERLFDYFKHMTTLCLLTLGGVLSIGSQTGITIEAIPMALVVGMLAVGGIGAYSGMVEIVESEQRHEPRPKRIAFYKGLSSLGFGLGTGAFLSTFLLSLFK